MNAETAARRARAQLADARKAYEAAKADNRPVARAARHLIECQRRAYDAEQQLDLARLIIAGLDWYDALHQPAAQQGA